jgi:hypothetical protein
MGEAVSVWFFGGLGARGDYADSAFFNSLGSFSVSSSLPCHPQILSAEPHRRFGFTALSIGLSLIALIVYAALFVYR